MRNKLVDQVRVGQSDLMVSAVGLGCNNFGWSIDAARSKPVVHAALDLGVTLFDTADIYGDPPGHAEEVLGRLLEGHREEVVLTTKFGFDLNGGPLDNRRDYMMVALEGSLRRLRTDRVDIYMVHIHDGSTPIDEILKGMDDIIRSGKARYIGCSNFAAWKFVEAHWSAKHLGTHGFIMAQNEYSLLAREPEQELIPALAGCGATLNPYFPLASGMLTGKYLKDGSGRLKYNFLGLGTKFLTERNHEIVRRLDAYATERGRSLLELAMSWLASQPHVAGIIAGATTAAQLKQNVAAASWKMTPDELAEIDKLSA
jgi:aryl-alcohol dehydrogenase-like predicted oxidoreductase